MPLTRTCSESMGLARALESARAPGRRRIARLLERLAPRIDRYDLARLNLDERLRQLDLAGGVEAHAPVECLHVEAGQRVADLLGIEGVGLLDGVLEGEHVGGSGSDVIVGLVGEAI